MREGLGRHPLWLALALSLLGHVLVTAWWRTLAPHTAVRVPPKTVWILGERTAPVPPLKQSRDGATPSASTSLVSAAPDEGGGASEAGDVAAKSDDTVTADVFWPSDQVDMRALPVMPPLTDQLAGMSWPAGHVWLRLAIGVDGRVVDVRLQPENEVLAEMLAPLLEMFRQVHFTPARKDGRDVASVQVIEVDAGTF